MWVIMEIHFQGLGWEVKLQKRRTSYFFTLIKELVRGNALKTGDHLYYYLVQCEGRNAVLILLDGKERNKAVL